MTSRTHDVIGFAALVTAAVYLPVPQLNVVTLGAALIGNTIGTLIPDIDQASNKLWSLLPAGTIVGRVGRRLLIEHRTISHSLLGAFLFWKLLNLVLPKILNPSSVNITIATISIMIGFISHLLADSITREGIPLFFPLPFKIGFPPIAALRITTGKLVEKLIVFPATLFYIVYIIYIKKEVIYMIFTHLAK